MTFGERSRRSCSQQCVELARGHIRVVGVDQLGREAEHAQQRERSEHDEAVAIEVLQQSEHLLSLALQHGVVERPVGGRQLDVQLLLLLGRQVGGDELLRPAQHERTDAPSQSGQARRAVRSAFLVLGHLSAARSAATYCSRKRRAEGNRPGAVSDSSAHSSVRLFSSGVPVIAKVIGARRSRAARCSLRLGVLDELRLVEHERRPVHAAELGLVEAQQRVRRDDDVGGCGDLADGATGLRARCGDRLDAQARGEPFRFAAPDRQDRRRRHDEERPALPRFVRVHDQRQHLQRLAEAHVVGEDAAQAMLPEEGEPVESGALVRAELGGEPGGYRRRLDPLHVAQALCGGSPRHGGLGLVGEILEVGPEIDLIAVDPWRGLPLGQRRGLVEQVPQPVERGVREREVAPVREQQLGAAPGQRGEQRGERDAAPVDRHDDAEVEPVGVRALHRADADLGLAGQLACIAGARRCARSGHRRRPRGRAPCARRIRPTRCRAASETRAAQPSRTHATRHPRVRAGRPRPPRRAPGPRRSRTGTCRGRRTPTPGARRSCARDGIRRRRSVPAHRLRAARDPRAGSPRSAGRCAEDGRERTPRRRMPEPGCCPWRPAALSPRHRARAARG